MPERQDFDPFRICDHAVIDVVMNSREVQTTHAGEGEVPGDSVFGGANVRLGEVADLDVERMAHSRLRSSERTWAMGVVRPRSH